MTLNLLQAEPGTTIDLTVARDGQSIRDSVNSVAKAYNALVKFMSDQHAAGQPLSNSAPLRAAMSSITNTFLSPVVGTTGDYTRPAVAGLSLQKDGTLALDAATFDAAIAKSYADVARLFQTGGSATNSEVTYGFSTEKSKPGTYAVNITTAATTAWAATGRLHRRTGLMPSNQKKTRTSPRWHRG